jgi:hypothetical protein
MQCSFCKLFVHVLHIVTATWSLLQNRETSAGLHGLNGPTEQTDGRSRNEVTRVTSLRWLSSIKFDFYTVYLVSKKDTKTNNNL